MIGSIRFNLTAEESKEDCFASFFQTHHEIAKFDGLIKQLHDGLGLGVGFFKRGLKLGAEFRLGSKSKVLTNSSPLVLELLYGERRSSWERGQSSACQYNQKKVIAATPMLRRAEVLPLKVKTVKTLSINLTR